MNVQAPPSHGVPAKSIVENSLGRLVAIFEDLCARRAAFARWYERRFYRALVTREAELARITPGSRILHVGAGRYPFTALLLAEMGHEIVAVDNVPEAVDMARRVVEERGFSERIEIRLADGRDVDTADFDAVWVSFHASPRETVIAACLAAMRPGTPLVGRMPAGMGSLAYSGENSFRGESASPFDSFKRIVVLRPGEEARGATLDCVPVAGRARIISGGDHPHLEPLGLRQGKEVCVRSRMPLGGALVVEVAGRKVALGSSVARQIRVATGDSD